ncbi:sensor histidine kinase [Silvimonas amylolytica]|uniref:histidine kinase n=1 Tax=Silvimonas amylolytica TaxID=449663 RepID=A0ABQ2PL48_9NEIS|nr:ATP-binding protein [Silvimonas amylolytica]GGP25950.1 two-component sensor histidine kinase [Silvimonas amylolytica]
MLKLFPQSLGFWSVTLFLTTVALLGATSVNALWMMESLGRQSRTAAQSAATLTEQAQRLQERTLTMERSARQFLILNDTSFRDRYMDAWKEAQSALRAVKANSGLHQPVFNEWLDTSETAGAVLARSFDEAEKQQRFLFAQLAHLRELNDEIAQDVRIGIANRNDNFLHELDRQRTLLMWQLIAVGGIAVVLIVAWHLGFARPLRRVVDAIHQLGENRLADPVVIAGPGDLRQLGVQLDWLRRRLLSSDEEKTRVLHHVSHELKTPLAALREGVALLDEGIIGPLEPRQREITGILQQNVLTLQARIEDLLRYQTIAWQARRLTRVAVDVREVLENTVADQKLQWQARNLEVTITGPNAVITADGEKLAMVVGNLLSNAIRFSPEGGTVALSCMQADGSTIIECADDGPGIPASEAARIFEPFYRGGGQPAVASPGHGIGLSIVRELVEAHGGVVELVAAGPGARFRITLPDESH